MNRPIYTSLFLCGVTCQNMFLSGLLACSDLVSSCCIIEKMDEIPPWILFPLVGASESYAGVKKVYTKGFGFFDFFIYGIKGRSV
ncbi:hypothetical protein RJ641_012619 [Dillenia turbinata]|uniref:Secreted protein n=1 Tax=Dillenia turbinata TaxID=194707 RepID=A0AAN8Z2I2_9MAGN